jgi:hypothetical protein
VPPHLAERLGKVVDDEPVVVREEVGAKRCPVLTMTSTGWLALPNIAMLASPETASWPRWKVQDSQ